jgi:Zn-dependent protease
MEFTLGLSTILIMLATLVVSITLHEMMHAYVGFKLGDTTAHEQGRISLNPLRHIDPFATVILPIITLVLFQAPILAAKPVPFNPDRVKFDEFGAALIAAAGPLTNLLLAVVGAAVGRLFVVNIDVFNALTIFVSLNIGLFVFNLIPIPPLDGSRVLYAFAPEPLQRLMAQVEQFGIFIVFGLILFFPPFVELLVNLNRAVSLFLL